VTGEIKEAAAIVHESDNRYGWTGVELYHGRELCAGREGGSASVVVDGRLDRGFEGLITLCSAGLSNDGESIEIGGLEGLDGSREIIQCFEDLHALLALVVTYEAVEIIQDGESTLPFGLGGGVGEPFRLRAGDMSPKEFGESGSGGLIEILHFYADILGADDIERLDTIDTERGIFWTPGGDEFGDVGALVSRPSEEPDEAIIDRALGYLLG